MQTPRWIVRLALVLPVVLAAGCEPKASRAPRLKTFSLEWGEASLFP